MGYAGIENRLEFENALASSQFFSDALNSSRNVLRHIFYIRLAKKMKGFRSELSEYQDRGKIRPDSPIQILAFSTVC
jgi:hypothetical protein